MAENGKWEIWIGSYAETEEVGITRIEMDGETGDWAMTAEYGGVENPSFLALNRSGTMLYAVSETMEVEGQPGGRMIAYPADPETRRLGAGFERLTHGAAPCHLSLDPTERWLAVANYFGASVTMYPLEADGKPGDAVIRLRHTGKGPNEERQEQPHPHAVLFDPEGGKFLFVPDLGIDQIVVYERSEDGLEWSAAGAAALPAGEGPRHLAFHPDGRTVYCVNELGSSVTRFVLREPGKLERRETVTTLPPRYGGSSACAEIAVSPDGRFVYASNRGHDSIAVFRTDNATGELQPAGHVSTRGTTPRHFALTPDGKWLLAANQDTNNIAMFRIDAHSGLPVFGGTEIRARQPVCILIRSL